MSDGWISRPDLVDAPSHAPMRSPWSRLDTRQRMRQLDALTGFPVLRAGRLEWAWFEGLSPNGLPTHLYRSALDQFVKQILTPSSRTFAHSELARGKYALTRLRGNPRLRRVVASPADYLASRERQLDRLIELCAADDLMRSAQTRAGSLYAQLLELCWFPQSVVEIREPVVLHAARTEPELCDQLARAGDVRVTALSRWVMGRLELRGIQVNLQRDWFFQLGGGGVPLAQAVLLCDVYVQGAEARVTHQICGTALPKHLWPVASEWCRRCLWMGRSVEWVHALLESLAGIAEVFQDDAEPALEETLALAARLALATDAPAEVGQAFTGAVANDWLAIAASHKRFTPRLGGEWLSLVSRIWLVPLIIAAERPGFAQRLADAQALTCLTYPPGASVDSRYFKGEAFTRAREITNCLVQGISTKALLQLGRPWPGQDRVLAGLVKLRRRSSVRHVENVCALVSRLRRMGLRNRWLANVIEDVLVFRPTFGRQRVQEAIVNRIPSALERSLPEHPETASRLIRSVFDLYIGGSYGGPLYRLTVTGRLDLVTGIAGAKRLAGRLDEWETLIWGLSDLRHQTGQTIASAYPALIDAVADNKLRLGESWYVGGLFLAAWHLAGQDADCFVRLLLALAPHARTENVTRVLAGGAVAAAKLEPLRAFLVRLAGDSPARCTALLQMLCRTDRIAPSKVAARLAPIFARTAGSRAIAPMSVEWPEALREAYAEYTRHASALKENCELPKALHGLLTRRETLRRELEFLISQSGNRPAVIKRIASLRKQLAEQMPEPAVINREVRRLQRRSNDLIYRRLEKLLVRILAWGLQAYDVPIPSGLLSDENWLNALDMLACVKPNRPLLRDLLLALLTGRRNWHAQLAANVAFRRKMNALGVRMDVWDSSFAQSYRVMSGKVESSRRRAVTIELAMADDPLEVLQMGNRFSTCLSADGINAYSVVANTVDANKRVIYAKLRGGDVVGRRLISMRDDGRILGYRTYRFPEYALDWPFHDYVHKLAEACNTQTADDGEPARLVAAKWYDDGPEHLSTFTGERPPELAAKAAAPA